MRIHVRSWALALLCAALISIGQPRPAAAEEALFTVEDVAVDRTATTAAQAQELALRDGEREALRQLFRRLVLPVDHDRLPALDGRDIAPLVAGVQVAEEKRSSTRYLARLTVRFRPEPVRELLRGAAVAFSESRAKPSLVLPVLSGPEGPRLWDEANPWAAAWSAPGAARSPFLPLVLPLGDLADVAAVTAPQALAGEAAALESLNRRYGTAAVLVVEAAPSETGDGLALSWRRIGGHHELSGEAQLPGAAAGEEPPYGEAVAAVVERLQADWKRLTAVLPGGELTLAASIPLTGVQDWTDTRRALRASPYIARVALVGLSQRQADVVLHYRGRPEQLADSLAGEALRLEQGADGWVLLPGAAEQSGGSPGPRGASHE